jgi:hypothetical protein
MVNGSQTVSSVASGAAQFARVSSAAVLSAESTASAGISEAVAAQPADQVVAAVGQAFRYNSFEFSYRQDFGKIVLLRQRPDTGEVVQQFPSEYYLRKYADGQRVAARSAEAGGAAKSVTTPEGKAPAAVTVAPTISVPAPDAAPSVPAAPALPGASVSAAAPRVDVTI